METEDTSITLIAAKTAKLPATTLHDLQFSTSRALQGRCCAAQQDFVTELWRAPFIPLTVWKSDVFHITDGDQRRHNVSLEVTT